MDPSQGLTILDYSVLGIILLSGLLALMRGFVREVLSLGAWIAAYFLAVNYYSSLVPWARGYVKNPTGATALAGIIIFVVILTVLTIVSYFAAKLIRGRALTAIDRSLGFLFGLGRGMLIVCLVYLGATYIPWLNMDRLDNAEAKPQIESETVNTPKPDDKGKEKDKEKEKPPEWLVNAKTRPALAYGANVLKVFIPEKAIEKTMQEYDEQSAAAHRAVTEKTEDMIGMPGKPAEKPEQTPDAKRSQAPSYDNQSRSNMNQLIEQKGNQ